MKCNCYLRGGNVIFQVSPPLLHSETRFTPWLSFNRVWLYPLASQRLNPLYRLLASSRKNSLFFMLLPTACHSSPACRPPALATMVEHVGSPPLAAAVQHTGSLQLSLLALHSSCSYLLWLKEGTGRRS